MEKPAVLGVRRSGKVRSTLADYGFGTIRSSRRKGSLEALKEKKEVRLRRVLEELSGLYAVFGGFLSARLDLLPGSFLKELQQIRVPLLIHPSTALKSLLPGQVVEPRPVANSVFCRFYEAGFGDRTVVLEVYGEGGNLRDRDFERFCNGLAYLQDDPLTGKVASRQVFEEFRSWLSLEGDPAHKNLLLANLQELPGDCITRFPRLVEELHSDRIIAYERWLEVGSNPDLTEETDRHKRLQSLFEAFLEQSLLLSVIPSLKGIDEFAELEGGRIGFRFCPPLESVPAELNYRMLQYVTSAVAGDRSRSIRMLSGLVDESGLAGSEPRLWQELSAQGCELELRSPFPESQGALNNYSRALIGAGLIKPRFLELFHRDLALLGQVNALQLPDEDLLSESIWPVLGRIVKYQLSQGLSAQSIKEWVVGSGLAMLGASRQMSVILEQLRMNDLSMVIAAQPVQGMDRESSRGGSWVTAVFLLALFFLSLQLAFSSSESVLGTVAGLISVVMALGLFVHFLRIG